MAGKERTSLNPSARSSARLGLGEVDNIAPGLLHCRYAGRIRLEHVEPLMREGDRLIAEGYRLLVALDADDVHAYESEVRKVVQQWIADNRANLEGFWVLFRSPLVKMGLNVVNAFTGGALRGFTDPEAFDRELAEAAVRAHAGELRQDPRAPVH
jgi:hypothetical protein